MTANQPANTAPMARHCARVHPPDIISVSLLPVDTLARELLQRLRADSFLSLIPISSPRTKRYS